ncbi:epidermal retinol dehydrogenase 2-like protein [Leptotrombidium deliense]|uniref:Short-chain dehydrogenase/reductase 3 n=1 Tax=Leptotrombidium deliense TaxID=299467 RepID=A0A443SCW4_9ACAR|nr:epidermal retinol dehydrogenase 2-like protein [Leptotrombidium deliense]
MTDVAAVVIGVLKFYFTWIFEVIVSFIPVKPKDVSKDIVLITGGGSGFGHLLAVKFAKLGSTLILWDINAQGLQETKEQIVKNGGKCHTYVCDICNRNEVYEIAEKVKKEVGNVTILVNNAGIAYSASFLKLNDENIERTFQVNTLSHFWTCKAFLPSMLNSNSGHIVSIASVASFAGIPKLSDYSASKAAAASFMESLFLELQLSGKNNIKLTAVCPYFMNTGMFAGSESSFMKNLEPEYAADIAMKGILRNEIFVTIPKTLLIPYALKPILPPKAGVEMIKLLGIDTALDNFVGRHKVSLNNNTNEK